MKTVVAIVVYNRFQNIQHWINCWNKCNPAGAELVVIHNYYGDEKEREKFSKYCGENSIRYVPRDGQGLDIGAFQDVCKGRLTGFPEWDTLIWITDDVFPMATNFVQQFLNTLARPRTGVACMEISPSVTMHIRTTGFAITKEVASKLHWPADPITTKEHCYLFEHRDKTSKFVFYNQVIRMGLTVLQVAPNEKSPLWDTGYWKRLNRLNEHHKIFPSLKEGSDKVVFICPIFEMYPQVISSLICQTHKNWHLILIHNGPCQPALRAIIKAHKDSRITFIEHPEPTGKWGHVLRQWALNELKEDRIVKDADYVVITNADNYHVPVYCDYMIKGFNTKHTTVATYCTDMVHSYVAWKIIPCRLALGYIDCCGVMVKKDIACEIGWRDVDSHSSDWTYFQDIATKYGPSNFVPVKGCLIVHN